MATVEYGEITDNLTIAAPSMGFPNSTPTVTSSSAGTYWNVTSSGDVTTYADDASNGSTVMCMNAYCVSDEEYVDMIKDYMFPTPFEWGLLYAYAVVFVIGLVGNFLVCFAVWQNRSMRTVTNYFIVNLAVADLLVLLICMPPTVLEDVMETWFFGNATCKIIKYFQVSCDIIRYLSYWKF